MTKAPERIWVCPDLIVPQDENGNIIDGSDKYPDWSCGTFWEGDAKDYQHGKFFVDADLHAELMRAADSLVDVSYAMANDDGDYWKPYVKAALTAYKQAKEKTNAI